MHIPYERLHNEYMMINNKDQARHFLSEMEFMGKPYVPDDWRNKPSKEVVIIAKSVFDQIVCDEIKKRGMLI